MKNYIYISLVMLFVSNIVVAQVDRSKAPEPGPAPKIQIGEYQSFELKNGLKVFVVENHKIPRVAFSLILNNKPIIEGDKAGYVDFTGQLLRNGTTNRSKAQLDEEIDFIGASMSTSSSGVFASSLTKHQDKLLELMTDVLYNPAFPEEELEKIRKQTLSGLAAGKEDPSTIASNVRRILYYGKDHPYGELTTEKTVENITLEDCKAYYNKYFKPNVAYLAVVGDIKFKDAKKLVQKYFNDWAPGKIKQPKYNIPSAPSETYVAIVDRASSVQSVINIGHPIQLEPGHPDVIKAGVLNQLLGGGFSSRLMQNLREDKAYTYGARSSLSNDDLVGNFTASASVRNEVTDSAVFEFLYELERIGSSPVTEEELHAAKASIIGSFARSLERPETIANFAINTARYNLPEDYYANYLKNVSATTIEDIDAMADKYIEHQKANIIIVGKASEVADKLAQFGPVKYFDIYGNEYDPSENAQLPEGLTADKVMSKYIEAIGGEENLSALSSLEIVMNAEAMGNSVELKTIKKVPNKFMQEVKIGGNVFTSQKYNGTDVVVTRGVQSIPMDENSKLELIIDAHMFPELFYEEKEVNMELIGIEKVNDSDAYAVKITYPTEKSFTIFFDVKTGLKVKRSDISQTPQGEMVLSTEFLDYKEKDGILIPGTIKIPMGPGVNMTATLQEFKINEEYSDDLFE